VQTLAQNGKPESEFWEPGLQDGEAEQRFNQVLNAYDLAATRRNAISPDGVREKLNSGAVLIVGKKIKVYDRNDPMALPRLIGHMVVMRKVSDTKIEIIDPADGTKKKFSFEKALDKITWVSDPPITGVVWEITP
jgi:hypothetical protein